MMKRLLKLRCVIVVVGLLFAQYTWAAQLDYFVPAPLGLQLSSDEMTLYNAGPAVAIVDNPNPSRQPLRIRAPFDLLTLPPESATAIFLITYVPGGSTDTWGEPCYAFPDAAKPPFEAAASIWANILQSSVPVTIRACWADFGPSSTLGYSGGGPMHRDFGGAPRPNTWYTGSLANALAGNDLAPSSFDMHITYNRNFSWFYGTGGNTPAGQHDFMSVVLHEIAHGLGFSGSMGYSTTTSQGSWGYAGYPTIYDTFTRDGSGNQLINTSVYANPSNALGTALRSGNIWFHGSNAMAANGGVRAKMYAPSTWAGGSSYSHLDYITFNNTPNQLMVYAISSNEWIHDPGPVTIGILKDLGWSTPSSAIMNLVTKYYNDILDRAPDSGGADGWTAEINRIAGLGIDIREGFQALAKFFFNSSEYALKNKSDVEFVRDLYQTFLNREPDPGGWDYWVGYLGQGLTRNMLTSQFAYSNEFKTYMEGIFGALVTRPENNLVNDLYRGLLNRFPDTGGFNGWVTLMKNAQCAGSQAVRDLTYQIALGFLQSAEYGLRNRDNSEYLEDLYNGLLRRGADPAGFFNWLNPLNLGTYTRAEVLQSFVNSSEFQLRVQEVINAGCVQ